MRIRGYYAIIAGALTAMLVLAGCAGTGEEKAKAFYNVKIVQLDIVPDMDEAREAIVRTLRDSELARTSEIRIDWASVGGEQLAAAEVIDNVAGQHPDLLITLSTTCLEQALKVTMDQPVVFAMTIDPFILGLDRSDPESNRPITGWYVEPPMEALIRITRMAIPKLHTVGVVWNPSDFASRYNMLAMRRTAQAAGLEIVEARVRHANTLLERIGELKAFGADVLVLFSDPVITKGLESITDFLHNASIPVVSNGLDAARDVALLDVGFDNRGWGEAAGKTALRVLAGEDPRKMEPQEFHELKIVVNKKIARSLKLTLPDELIKEADQVIE